ncbi:hypothetical protein THASP1DRAFT_29182 [Thamnocephalis sphaerospora]|uniref:F-box domain-containing protein n=1 Tax=Thamnocephalis sphaerospora TaxID=78915 RepID=A0A4P9XTY7_9FUNG|nr:hypothetical protein THASP1DRAFT_29182 [Thamnocephalis sphaerospora]|eukprot:RKP09031.1 hypothetical protein THASP1DRAFT_29182 [Thamnocephalis sphaerospora]
MKHIPNEILDLIFNLLDDDTLLALARVSEGWKSRVALRQTLWRQHFKLEFLQFDDAEQEWLHQYRRTYEARMLASQATNKSSSEGGSAPICWLDACLKRHAFEHRLHHGHYTSHQLTSVANIRPTGTRIQSIPYVPCSSSARNVKVASQWLTASQQYPMWLLEQPCWDGIDVEHMGVSGNKWQSDRYLAITTWSTSIGCHSLYVWDLDALHKPPNVIAKGKWQIRDVEMYGNWLVCRYMNAIEIEQQFKLVCHLKNETHRMEIPGDCSRDYIQRVAADSACIIRIGNIKGTVRIAMTTYTSQQITSGQTALLQEKAVIVVKMHYKYGGSILLQRVDDNRFILWSSSRETLDSYSAPTIVLVEIVDSVEGISLRESLSDGTEVNHLYSPIQMRNSLEDAIKYNPRNDAKLDIPRNAQQESSPTATLYGYRGTFTVVDYTSHICHSKPTIKQKQNATVSSQMHDWMHSILSTLRGQR